MEQLKKYFPFVFQSTDVKSLVISIVVYVVAEAIAGLIIGFLSSIPIIGFIFSIVGTLVGLYALAAIVLSILVFLKVVK